MYLFDKLLVESLRQTKGDRNHQRRVEQSSVIRKTDLQVDYMPLNHAI
jgi:hypothetical protein